MRKDEEVKKIIIPMFPLPGVVMFPGMNLPLHIFEERYKKMIATCLENDKTFGVVYAKGNMCAEVGTIAEIINVEKLEEGKMNLLTEGKSRFKIIDFVSEDPYYVAQVAYYEDKDVEITEELKGSIKEVKQLSKKALKIFDEVSDQELVKKIRFPDNPNEFLFLVAANLSCSFEIKQAILESRSIKERTKKIHSLLKKEIKRLEILLKNKQTRDEVEKNGKLHL